MHIFSAMDLSISMQQLKVVIPLVVGLIAYLAYWFIQESVSLREKLIRRFGKEKGSIRIVIWSKYLGAVLLGLLPFLAYMISFPDTKLGDLGFAVNKETAMASLYWMAGISVILVPLLIFLSKSQGVLKKQPEIRVAEWNRKLVFNNLLAWAIYLLGYEFFFRGVLFYPLLETIGLWPAIAVNVVFYAGAHLPKGADEAIGAIPLAIVLCLLGAYTGTIWIAYFVHLAMAWTVNLAALKHQPNMNIVKSKR